MKFGQTDHPENIDFTLPKDHPDTAKVLAAYRNDAPFEVSVGCAKWNRKDLHHFYPRGTKDELGYYATQFNAIELNATFYRSPTRGQVEIWRDKTPDHFRFYPKIPSSISHFSRLLNIKKPLLEFSDAISRFEDRLGMSFLQLHENFGPKDYGRLADFVKAYPKGIPLAVELRNAAWFTGEKESENLFQLLKNERKAAILVDTAGRRDVLHMRLTTSCAFVRYVGANHPTDYSRLDDWIKRIKHWRKQGLQSLCFFVHQNVEKESPLLSAYFIEKLNDTLKPQIKIPDKQ